MHIRQITFSATFDDRHNMISVPERLTRARLPFGTSPYACRPAQLAKMADLGDTIDAAMGTDAAIPLKDALAQMGGITAQTPLFDTPLRAEGKPACRHFEAAPATEAASVFAFWKRSPISAASWHRALLTHAYKI